LSKKCIEFRVNFETGTQREAPTSASGYEQQRAVTLEEIAGRRYTEINQPAAIYCAL